MHQSLATISSAAAPVAGQRRAAGLHYAIALLAVAAATLVRWVLDPWLGDSLAFTLYFAALMFVAWFASLGPSLAALLLSACAAEFCFVPPRYTWLFYRGGFDDVPGTVTFLVAGLAIIAFAEGMRKARSDAEARGELLREAGRSYARLYEESPGMMWSSDMRTFRIVQCNQAVAQALGYTKEELIGMPLTDLYAPEGRAASLRARERFLITGVLRDVELQLLRKDGTRLEVSLDATAERDADGRIVRSRSSWHDITARKEAERQVREHARQLRQAVDALRRSEAHVRELVDAMPQIVFTATPDGKVDYVNRYCREFAGGGEEMATAGRLRYLHADDHAPMRAAWERAISTGSLYQIECRFMRADGQYRWMIARALPIRAPDGRIERWVGTCTDIDERKRAEGENLRLVDTLAQADRRKDAFLATLAHELRNPLAPIANALALMSSSAASAEQMQKAREMIGRQLRHMTRLIDDLLDVSRIASGKLELHCAPVALADVVAQAVESSRPFIDARGHTLMVVAPDAAIGVHADAVRLAQVLTNLLVNAAKFTPQCGHIELTSALLAAQHEGRTRIALSVKDSGIGIAPENLARLFDTFYQVDVSLERTQGGLGLGLALARRLIALHGGSIECLSAGLGRGSEFRICLPVVPLAQREAAPARVEASRPAQPGRLILVADDNREAAESLALFLRLEGDDVETVHDGLAAVEVAGRLHPSIALLDLGMPGLNGYETARRIREQPWGRDMLLIAQTGWGQDEDRRRTHDAGFDAHFVKPLDLHALRGVLAGVRPG